MAARAIIRATNKQGRASTSHLIIVFIVHVATQGC
jgi:hypothetical protein